MVGRLAIVACLLCLAGCGSPGPQQPDLQYQAKQLQQASVWQMLGKMSFRADGKTRTVTIDWSQRFGAGNIVLTGPLGSGSVRIGFDEASLQVDDGQQVRRYPAGDQIIVNGQAYELPWQRLGYWIRGLEGPGGKTIDAEYRYEGWQITLLRSDENGPQMIGISHRDVSLRLRVKSWSVGEMKSVVNLI